MLASRNSRLVDVHRRAGHDVPSNGSPCIRHSDFRNTQNQFAWSRFSHSRGGGGKACDPRLWRLGWTFDLFIIYQFLARYCYKHTFVCGGRFKIASAGSTRE
ncbi:hypothetical protein GWI33_022037 [Rhynchophorus ferrugineus]|uniref:Uncharacterized protein n=1 Tax=Rhynchophorus ferrugineus TaxID=354439 RepID=A0A834MI22_RHYFE|nr:hypothetical protein GWI33_022037 [Rhynchophorus ferrugineus]